MANKDDLMASLMMGESGGGGTEEVTAAGVPTAVNNDGGGDEAPTTTTSTSSSNNNGLFDNDDDPPPLALPLSSSGPPNNPSPSTTTTTSLFGSIDNGGGGDDLFGHTNSNNKDSLFGTDDIFASQQEPPVVTGPPPLPPGPPPPLPPVPPPASAPPPPLVVQVVPQVLPNTTTNSGGESETKKMKSSMLAESGLLGTATIPTSSGGDGLFGDEATIDVTTPSTLLMGGGGGGLFDDIDHQQEEAEKQQNRERLLQQEREVAAAAASAEAARIQMVTEQQQQQQQNHLNHQLKIDESQQQQFFDQERKKREELDNLYYTQSLQDQMQSIHLGNAVPPSNTLNGYQQQQHHHQQQPLSAGHGPNNNNNNNNFLPPQQQQSPCYPTQQQQQPMGLHNSNNHHHADLSSSLSPNRGMMGSMIPASPHRHPHPLMANPTLINPTKPPPPISEPMYGRVIVSEPILVQSDSFFGVRQPPHWSYQIATEILPTSQNPGGIWLVRRRFRHVVSLEDRLRDDCPGAILPPRPEKHATRAIEEASASQSIDFALQRAAELQVFLNELVYHPICYKSPVLRLFLALQDDLGIAWAECSGNALTRLANAGVGAAMKVSETSATSKLPWQSTPDDIGGGEDNAELLAFQSAESIRMGMVQQAVPKLEGAVTLLREHAELAGATGMELNRLVKELQSSDIELAQPFDIVSAGLLRSGRRSKRLAIEAAAAIHSFQHHYKMCRYEKFAFQDRKNALQRRHKERMKADQRAAQLLLHQRASYASSYGNPNIPQNPYQQQQYQQQHQPQYGYPYGDRVLAQEAATADLYATDVWNEADEIGQKLKSEVYRCAWNRRNEWTVSLKVIASSMKEAVTERVGIWETIHDSFLQAFPEYKEPNTTTPPNNNTVGASVQVLQVPIIPSSPPPLNGGGIGGSAVIPTATIGAPAGGGGGMVPSL